MKDINSIVIYQDEYKSREEFENAIKKAIMVLLDNDYIMTVKNDDKGLGIVVIEFEHDNQEYGCDYPYWLSPDEYESVITDEEREELKNEQDC